jgi:putative transposase
MRSGPKQRFEVKQQEVGIDLGPSTAAIVSPDRAVLVSFLPEMKEDLAAKRVLQRALDRSRRASNPHCFNADGTWKRGQRQTVYTQHYQQLRTCLAEQERVMAERRDRAHGRLSNIVLRDFGNASRQKS